MKHKRSHKTHKQPHWLSEEDYANQMPPRKTKQTGNKLPKRLRWHDLDLDD